MHNAAFRQVGRVAFYVPVDVTVPELGRALAAFRVLGGQGVNLTRPLKEAVLRLPGVQPAADDPWVSRVQAANTLKWLPESNRWLAANTDAAALYGLLPAGQGRPALVLGSGGVARASVGVLQARGYRCWVAARRPLAVNWVTGAVEVVEWETALGLSVPWGAVVNATPLGQVGEPGFTRWPAIGPGTVVVEWVYHPVETPLVAHAQAVGATIVDGLTLLVEQAALAWRVWFGQDGPRAVMRQAAMP